VTQPPLRILLASPAYWPARAFGGPIVVARELVRRLVERGHTVEVITTAVLDLHGRPAARTSRATVDGAEVRYLATPFHYRWMGIVPTLPLELLRAGRPAPPDVVHVFGFRDPVTTLTAAWCRRRRIPYVFEPLGMFRPRLRKVRLKGALDASLYRGVAAGAALAIAASERERDDIVAGGVPPERVRVRGNGFPEPIDATRPLTTDLRAQLGIPADARIVLYVGRVAAGKGIEHLLAVARELPTVHVVLAGPDDRHGVAARVHAAQTEPATAGRIHLLAQSDEPPAELYRQANVFVLASAGESFGMVAAEAAAAGAPVVVSDRCGITSFFRDGEALVVPDTEPTVVAAVRSVLDDPALREQLAAGGVAAARRQSWDHVADLQEELYREAIASRTAATKLSTLGS
jgi:glycosyltransferase involved in cell wall biosynthesis